MVRFPTRILVIVVCRCVSALVNRVCAIRSLVSMSSGGDFELQMQPGKSHPSGMQQLRS